MSFVSDLDSWYASWKLSHPGYFVRPLFWFALVVMVAFVGFVFYSSPGFSGSYLSCRGPSPCFNEFYESGCSVYPCGLQYLAPGELYGVVPPWFVRFADVLLWFFGLGVFGLNHLIWIWRKW